MAAQFTEEERRIIDGELDGPDYRALAAQLAQAIAEIRPCFDIVADGKRHKSLSVSWIGVARVEKLDAALDAARKAELIT